MHKIAPCIWFDHEALAAAEFYTSIFKDGKIKDITHYIDNEHMPAGTILTVRFTIANQEFNLLNGGPIFKVTPALSFFVDCQTEAEFDTIWQQLTLDGKILMDASTYPFSKKFGWLEDKYGVSWQLDFSGLEQKITPYLMFSGTNYGKAKEAIAFYQSVFTHTGTNNIFYDEDNKYINHATFELDDQSFIAMDSAENHQFSFSEGLSLFVYCETQAEIDYLWEALTKDGKEQPCGWLIDKYGLSWQIAGAELDALFAEDDIERATRVTNALYDMKKIDLQVLRDAYNNK